MVQIERRLEREDLEPELLWTAKRAGSATRPSPGYPAAPSLRCACLRESVGMFPVYKMVDTCAGEFAAATPYFYSTYEEEDEAVAARPVAGGRCRLRADPHRAGIEFDYSRGAGGPSAP